MFQKMLLEMLVKILGQLITPEIIKNAKEMAICWLQTQVASTENKIDDAVVKIIAEALDVDSCPAVVPAVAE